MGISNHTSDLEQNTMPSKSLIKIKRLLSTLLQFASTLNVDAGETVKTLIFNLAVSSIFCFGFHFLSNENLHIFLKSIHK